MKYTRTENTGRYFRQKRCTGKLEYLEGDTYIACYRRQELQAGTASRKLSQVGRKYRQELPSPGGNNKMVQ
jgi:hypothetical protein